MPVCDTAEERAFKAAVRKARESGQSVLADIATAYATALDNYLEPMAIETKQFLALPSVRAHLEEDIGSRINARILAGDTDDLTWVETETKAAIDQAIKDWLKQ